MQLCDRFKRRDDYEVSVMVPGISELNATINKRFKNIKTLNTVLKSKQFDSHPGVTYILLYQD